MTVKGASFPSAIPNFNVTYDAFAFMLYRLLSYFDVTCEMNLDQCNFSDRAKLCIEAVQKKSFFPNGHSLKFLGSSDYSKCGIGADFLSFVADLVKAFAAEFPVLLTSKQLNDLQAAQESKQKSKQVAGGHESAFNFTSQGIVKKTKKSEFDAYISLQYEHRALAKFFPKLIESKAENGKFLITLEDLTADDDYNLIDLKISLFIKDRYSINEVFRKGLFHISGILIKENREIVNMYRHSSAILSKEEFHKIFNVFFGFADSAELQRIVDEVESFLSELVTAASESEFGLNESSLLLLYSPKTRKLKLRMVDLAYHESFFDSNVGESCRGIVAFLREYANSRN